MRSSWLSSSSFGLVFLAVADVGSEAAPVSRAAGTGPAVGTTFAAATFEADGMPDAVMVAWRDAQGIHSGLLRIDDGSFDQFPVQPASYVTNLAVGAVGPASDRRAAVLWVGNQLELLRTVFDAGGNVLAPPAPIASAAAVPAAWPITKQPPETRAADCPMWVIEAQRPATSRFSTRSGTIMR